MYYTYNSSERGKPGGKRFLLLDSICWRALNLAENPCTAPPSSPLPRLFNHKWSHWLTRNSGIEWPCTEVCHSVHLGRHHKNVRHRGGDLLGVYPPPPSPFHPNLSAVPLPVCILSRPPAHVRPDVRQSLFFFFFKNMFRRQKASESFHCFIPDWSKKLAF